MAVRISKRRRRDLREYLTAYLMVAPALALIFTFGIFPVLFAVYVSMHKWKIKQGDFLGLENYVRAIDNLAYLLFFAVILGFAYAAVRAYRQVAALAREHNERPWLLAVPAAVHAGVILLFGRYIVVLLPEILEIADKVRKLKRTQALFVQLFGEALRAETVLPAFKQWLLVFGVGIVVTIVVWRLIKVGSSRQAKYLGSLTTTWLFAAGSAILGWFTVAEMQRAIAEALETGEEVRIWVQIVTISAGLLLLFLAWKLWQSGVNNDSDRSFVWRIFAALALIVAGWLLIAEIPMAIQAGDKDIWQGLVVTVYYAMGTIPFQLGIALVLAYLLFQKVKGKEFFRMMFFMPYVTPAVASAAVFALLFSPRAASPINKLLAGDTPLRWLQESRGIFTLIGQSLGVELPTWASGPSLALVVIIIYSIWTYVGYDTVIYLAGLGNISTEVNEAAAIDGANRWQIFRYITLPLLSPTTYFLSLIAVIGTFKAFNHIFVMRHDLALGTTDTFSVAIFDEFFTKTRFGYASAMAFVLFAVILALTYINNKIQGSRVFYG